MWPVHGIIGENGAFYFYYDEFEKKIEHRYFFSPEEAKKRRADLDAIKKEVLNKVPRAGIASDQPYRLFDLAIDFSEDVPPLTEEEIDRICKVFSKHGAHYKISSIHVNGWFGDYDKLTMTRLYIQEQLHMDGNEIGQEFLFIGDSPNDEPMFKVFPISIGVANIERFTKRMKVFPAYITHGKGSLGFAEMAHIIIEKKGVKNVD
jgi:hydroxymethylpyrimidine pyrophosphatase-like HAD family hydrolase